MNGDPFMIYLGYMLSLLSLIACVWYGIKNWNNSESVKNKKG